MSLIRFPPVTWENRPGQTWLTCLRLHRVIGTSPVKFPGYILRVLTKFILQKNKMSSYLKHCAGALSLLSPGASGQQSELEGLAGTKRQVRHCL